MELIVKYLKSIIYFGNFFTCDYIYVCDYMYQFAEIPKNSYSVDPKFKMTEMWRS